LECGAIPPLFLFGMLFRSKGGKRKKASGVKAAALQSGGKAPHSTGQTGLASFAQLAIV
jgi:hypothetical protein